MVSCVVMTTLYLPGSLVRGCGTTFTCRLNRAMRGDLHPLPHPPIQMPGCILDEICHRCCDANDRIYEFCFFTCRFFYLKKKKTEDLVLWQILVNFFTCWLQWWPLWVDKSFTCVHKVKFSSDQLCRNLYLFVCAPIVLWTSGILLL